MRIVTIVLNCILLLSLIIGLISEQNKGIYDIFSVATGLEVSLNRRLKTIDMAQYTLLTSLSTHGCPEILTVPTHWFMDEHCYETGLCQRKNV